MEELNFLITYIEGEGYTLYTPPIEKSYVIICNKLFESPIIVDADIHELVVNIDEDEQSSGDIGEPIQIRPLSGITYPLEKDEEYRLQFYEIKEKNVSSIGDENLEVNYSYVVGDCVYDNLVYFSNTEEGVEEVLNFLYVGDINLYVDTTVIEEDDQSDAKLFKEDNIIKELEGAALISFGNRSSNGVMQNNYGIGINSSDDALQLPPQAITLFKTTINPEQSIKVSYDYQAILGTLPIDGMDDLTDSNIYRNMQGTQGIFTNNMYIGDKNQFVAFYTDTSDNENPTKRLAIRAQSIVFETGDGTYEEVSEAVTNAGSKYIVEFDDGGIGISKYKQKDPEVETDEYEVHITNSQFNILNENHNVISSFGKEIVLGASNQQLSLHITQDDISFLDNNEPIAIYGRDGIELISQNQLVELRPTGLIFESNVDNIQTTASLNSSGLSSKQIQTNTLYLRDMETAKALVGQAVVDFSQVSSEDSTANLSFIWIKRSNNHLSLKLVN